MKNKKVLFFIMTVVLIAAAYISVNVGSVNVPFIRIVRGLFNGAGGDVGIIRDLRLPRIALSIIVGANLAVAGVLLQAVMRNPLADPGIIGISSGASVFAAVILLYFPKLHFSLPLISFAGGALACCVIYSLAWKKGLSPVRIILAGVAVNAVLGGMSSMLSILNSDKMQSILMWLNGSISTRGWKDVRMLLVYSVVGLTISFLMYKSCDLLSLGDKTATNLGINVNVHRLLISGAAVFLAGTSTSIVGVIGFIGLVVPHISRMIIGSSHKYLIPFSAITGSVVLLLADTLGRVAAKPYEIPVGVVTAVLGGPFFLYLLRRSEKA